MKEINFTIKYIEKLQIESIKSILMNEEQENWNRYNFRGSYDINIDTNTIPLYWVSNDFSVNNLEPTKICRFNEFKKYFVFVDEIKKILNPLYPNTTVVKAFFSKLRGHGKIPEHRDSAEILRLSNRIHLSIATNDNVIFSVDDNKFNFKEGELIEVNNVLNHYVENNDKNDRIHLIIDLLDNNHLNNESYYVDIVDEKLEGFDI